MDGRRTGRDSQDDPLQIKNGADVIKAVSGVLSMKDEVDVPQLHEEIAMLVSETHRLRKIGGSLSWRHRGGTRLMPEWIRSSTAPL